MDEISSHTAYQRSFRLFEIRPINVIVSIISIVTVCVRVCVLIHRVTMRVIQFVLFGIF